MESATRGIGRPALIKQIEEQSLKITSLQGDLSDCERLIGRLIKSEKDLRKLVADLEAYIQKSERAQRTVLELAYARPDLSFRAHSLDQIGEAAEEKR